MDIENGDLHVGNLILQAGQLFLGFVFTVLIPLFRLFHSSLLCQAPKADDRQKSIERTKACEVLMSLDHQCYHVTGAGLCQYQVQDDKTDPYLWRSLTLVTDAGPDMCAAVQWLKYQHTGSYDGSVSRKPFVARVLWDPSHAGKNALKEACRETSLWPTAQLYCVSVKAVNGPWNSGLYNICPA